MNDEVITEPASEETPETAPAEQTEVALAYQGESRVVSAEGESELRLFGNLHRDPVRFQGQIKDPLKFREALAAVYAIVGSDYRYVPKDRTAYLAYRRMKQQSSNLAAWEAQQAYFEWLSRNDPLAWLILDPIITVHPDAVLFEVFSKDEGCYACLNISREAFHLAADKQQMTFGTTNIDFSQTLFDGVLQMRSYRETGLSISQDVVGIATGSKPEVLEKQIRVPDSWIRGFLQVQSAATLPRDRFKLAPIDLYNVLRHLRMHADEKGKRRGLRVELIPGEKPVIVLEPWEKVLSASAEVYQGRQAKVVRIWGRRRLMLLQRLLPFVDEVEVHILGSGLPSFWVLKSSDLTITLGMTGFTSANWSQAASFDLLLPRKTQETQELKVIIKHLSKTRFDDEAGIMAATKLTGETLHEALQTGCQQGQLMFDLARNVYRLRPLTNVPLNLERLEYRNQRERQAHDLLARKNAVSITTENRIYGTGLELTGRVTVAEDKREYRPQLLITEDGGVSKAECTCPFFRKQGLQHGPCSHLIALRLTYALREKERAASGKSRATISVETRTYSRRDETGEDVYQISLDRHKLRLRWGKAGGEMRSQNFRFNSTDEARTEYLARLESLTSKGYLDASAG